MHSGRIPLAECQAFVDDCLHQVTIVGRGDFNCGNGQQRILAETSLQTEFFLVEIVEDDCAQAKYHRVSGALADAQKGLYIFSQ